MNENKINKLFDRYVNSPKPHGTEPITTLTQKSIQIFSQVLKQSAVNFSLKNEEFFNKTMNGIYEYQSDYADEITGKEHDKINSFIESIEHIQHYTLQGTEVREQLDIESIINDEDRNKYLNEFYKNIDSDIQIINEQIVLPKITLDKILEKRFNILEEEIAVTCELITDKQYHENIPDIPAKNNLVELQDLFEEYNQTATKLYILPSAKINKQVNKTINLFEIDYQRFLNERTLIYTQFTDIKQEHPTINLSIKEQEQYENLQIHYFDPDEETFATQSNLVDVTPQVLNIFRGFLKSESIQDLIEIPNEITNTIQINNQFREEYLEEITLNEIKEDTIHFDAIQHVQKFIRNGNDLSEKTMEELDQAISAIRKYDHLPALYFEPNPEDEEEDQEYDSIFPITKETVTYFRSRELRGKIQTIQAELSTNTHKEIIPKNETLQKIIEMQNILKEYQLIKTIGELYQEKEVVKMNYEIIGDNSQNDEKQLEHTRFCLNTIPAFELFDETPTKYLQKHPDRNISFQKYKPITKIFNS